jgi:3-dehydroquinate synthase/2-deoxy-scyllo-inosose synthase
MKPTADDLSMSRNSGASKPPGPAAAMTVSLRQFGHAQIPFHLGTNCAAEIAREIKSLQPDRLFVLADADVWQLHGQRFQAPLADVAPMKLVNWDAGESTKTLSSIESLASDAIGAGITRRSVLVSIGGGIVGNLTGLLAALLYRGIRFVHVPTTLLAMHDSVTSLKQGVNLTGGKNILGAFHTPSAVYLDLKFLESLPASHTRAGVVELVKNGLVMGGKYFDAISRRLPGLNESNDPAKFADLIQLGIDAKCELMKDDPFERGRAMIMEYGHTLGHAIELTSAGQLNHGDSVAWGMQCAARISRELGFMSDETFGLHQSIIAQLGPLPKPRSVHPAGLRQSVSRDNKRGYLECNDANDVAMVLLRGVGDVVNSDSPHPLVLVRGGMIDLAIEALMREWS